VLRVAFLTLYPKETASTRQRIYNNVALFPDDVEATILPGISSASVERLARSGGDRGARLRFLAAELARKLGHIRRARDYDVVVLQKGLTVMNLRGLPGLLFAAGRPVVYDFDDAVHLGPPQAFRADWLRRVGAPDQILQMMPRFAAVVAGNTHLAAVAAEHNPRVTVVGTPMDTDLYRIRPIRRNGPVRVGWSGSSATNHYVNRLAPALVAAAKRVPEIEFTVISNDDRGIDWARFDGVRTSFVTWRLDRMIDDLLELDVGVMPLDDDEWSRSKCGGKILQYMACGIPPVASPVGINVQVIEHGVSGFLAASDDAWCQHLVQLAREPELREKLGGAARISIERRHSNRVVAPQLLEVVRAAAELP